MLQNRYSPNLQTATFGRVERILHAKDGWTALSGGLGNPQPVHFEGPKDRIETGSRVDGNQQNVGVNYCLHLL